MTKELITKLTTQLETYEKKVFNDLLKSHNIASATFKQIVLTEIKKSPKMLEAFERNPSSMFASIIFCAQLGLMPSDSLGQFYFIPYNTKNGFVIKPMIGYQGLVSILLRGGEVTSIYCESVHEGDLFEYELGLNPILKHQPIDPYRTSVSFTYVYCVATLKNGTKQFKVMSKAELLATISLQKERNDLYFNDKKDPNFWMLKKMCLKQLAKFLPKDYVGTLAIQNDSAVEGGATLTLDESDNVIINHEEKESPKEKGMFSDVIVEDIQEKA
jgi:recombination protein RecT